MDDLGWTKRPRPSIVEPEETFWTEDRWMDTEKAEIEIETGICGDQIVLRLTGSTGMVTTLKMDPDYARTLGRNIIGQANLISPPDRCEEGPGPEIDPDYHGDVRNYVDPMDSKDDGKSAVSWRARPYKPGGS
jgi:hypothetical protein